MEQMDKKHKVLGRNIQSISYFENPEWNKLDFSPVPQEVRIIHGLTEKNLNQGRTKITIVIGQYILKGQECQVLYHSMMLVFAENIIWAQLISFQYSDLTN